MVGILAGSAVVDLLELLFGLISAVGSRRPVIRLHCSPVAWSHVQQDLALRKAVWANACSVNITMSACMVRRTSRIPDCGNTAANELMMESYAMMPWECGPDDCVALNTSAGGLDGQKPMNRTPAPLNIQKKRVDVRGLRSGRASMSAF